MIGFPIPLRVLTWAALHVMPLGIVLLLPSTLRAQPAIEGYADYKLLSDQIKALDESDLVNVSSLGKTLSGREVLLISISQGPPEAKPAILIVGNVEAGHLVGSELAMRIAQQIVGTQANAETSRKMLERFTFYIIPRPSPDASEHFFDRPSIERSGNDRSTDDDRDGETDEDPAQDLNGDDVITMMRVEDASGAYIQHPSDARVMIKADSRKNEQGRYAMYSEGRDDDGDEAFNEDGPGGVSFNRNFPHRYPFFEPLAGPHQVSEVETRAVADFAFAHPNIALVFSFSPEDNLLVPWKPGSGSDSRLKPTINSSDAEYVNYLAEQYRAIVPAKDAPTSPAGTGSFSEWAYYQYGRWSLAARGWWIPKTVAKNDPAVDGAKDATAKPTELKTDDQKNGDVKNSDAKNSDKDKRGADDLSALAWFKQEGIDGFVDWRPFEHPDFPGKKVEIGGFKPFLRHNPPSKEFAPLAEKHFRFITRLTELMPRIEIAAVEVKSLGSNVYRVTAQVRNGGFLPTMATFGRTANEAYPLQIHIDLPAGAKLITGHARSRFDRLGGNGEKAEHAWLLVAPTPGTNQVVVSINSPCVGKDSKSVELK